MFMLSHITKNTHNISFINGDTDIIFWLINQSLIEFCQKIPHFKVFKLWTLAFYFITKVNEELKTARFF